MWRYLIEGIHYAREKNAHVIEYISSCIPVALMSSFYGAVTGGVITLIYSILKFFTAIGQFLNGYSHHLEKLIPKIIEFGYHCILWSAVAAAILSILYMIVRWKLVVWGNRWWNGDRTTNL